MYTVDFSYNQTKKNSNSQYETIVTIYYFDIINIYIKADEQNKNIIEDAKFEAKGCPPVIASCCVVTEMIKKMEIEKAKTLTANEIINKLNGLPKEKEHCAELVIKTLRKAIENIN